MVALTKIFNGTELPIEAINENEFMVNIAGIAKAHGKNITDWKDSKRVKETLSVLEKSNDLKGNLIDFSINGKTMIHNKLLVNFARFISVEFEIWADKMIFDIITGSMADKHQCEIEDIMMKSKECNVYEKNGGRYSSCRGVLQNIPEIEEMHDEHTFKTFLHSKGLIEPVYKRVKVWRVTSKGKKTNLFDHDTSGTILYNLDQIEKEVDTLLIEQNIHATTAKKINVYNGFTGEFHCTFESTKQAEDETGVVGISGVLNGKRGKRHIRGMIFTDGEPVEKIAPLEGDDLKKIFRDINVFDENGVLVERCSTNKEAGLIGGNGTTQVGRLLKNGKANSAGFTYAYAELEFTKRN